MSAPVDAVDCPRCLNKQPMGCHRCGGRGLVLSPSPASGEWRAEVVTSRGECWAGNALTFASEEEAERYVRDLAFRWTVVRLARVVPTSTPLRESCDYDDPGPVVVDYR